LIRLNPEIEKGGVSPSFIPIASPDFQLIMSKVTGSIECVCRGRFSMAEC